VVESGKFVTLDPSGVLLSARPTSVSETCGAAPKAASAQAHCANCG